MQIDKCPNSACSSNVASTPLRINKMGLKYLKAERTYTQRYRCMTCKKTFCQSILSEHTHKHKHEKYYSLRKEIQDLYCQGMTLRGVSRKLGISTTTVAEKIKLLCEDSWHYYLLSGEFKYKWKRHAPTEEMIKEGLILGHLKTPLIVFDEMETHEHTYLKPISIGIAYDYVNKKIIDIQVAEFLPRGRYAMILKHRPKLQATYAKIKGVRVDTRSQMNERVFESIYNYTNHAPFAPEILTDGKRAYITTLKKVFNASKFTHIVMPSKGVSSSDDDEDKLADPHTGLLPDPEVLRDKTQLNLSVKTKLVPKKHVSAMGSFNRLCATMRGDISRLRRTTYIHTKDINSLQEVLYVYMDYWNKNH